ncbi:MAG: hypothetical protein AABN33_20170 [Acidobacteriota bacterium]
MPTDPLDVVGRGLQAYADRGVFRGFDEVKSRNGKPGFRFVWLGSRLLNFSLDSQKGVLKFKNLLPNVPSNSMLYSDLKRFLKSRSDRKIPKHRRVDASRAEVSWTNRRGNVSIALTVKNNQYAYGLNKLVNLVHEIFVLLNDSYADYMSENFDAPQE